MPSIRTIGTLALAALAGTVWADDEPGEAVPDAVADDVLASVSADLERLRELEFRRPVRARHASPEELRSYIRQQWREQLGSDELRDYQNLLRAVGLLPPDYDLLAGLEDVLVSQVAGYYDPARNTFFLTDLAEGFAGLEGALLASAGNMLLIHELQHALADQHFDLAALMDVSLPDEDLSNAVRALPEGDATLTMVAYVTEELGLAGTSLAAVGQTLQAAGSEALLALPGGDGLADVPPYLVEALLFGYVDGFAWVAHLHAAGGWDLVDRAYAAPPQSTEQVLHPERYHPNGDGPTRVEPPALPPFARRAGVEPASIVLGELGVRAWLRHWGGDREADAHRLADAAAAGWDGDRLVVFTERDGGRTWLAWVTAWDGADEAAEFFTAARARLPVAGPEPIELVPDGRDRLRGETASGRHVRLERSGTRVWIVEGWERKAVRRVGEILRRTRLEPVAAPRLEAPAAPEPAPAAPADAGTTP